MSDMPRDPPRDLTGGEAVKMLRSIAEDASVCMLVTQHDQFPLLARPMGIQGVDDDGTVWFLSSSETDKNEDIERDPRVTLLLQNNKSYEYAQLSGHASIHRDRALIEKYWTPVAKIWFEGKDDPRLTLLAVHPVSGYYWTTRNGRIVTGVRMLLSAAGAKVDEGGVHGQLKV